jgi:predicted RNase H-like HicB family nuclease
VSMKLPVAIFKDADSDYGVVFPDLPGCISAGSTFESALIAAKEAAECHIEGMILDKDPVPEFSVIDDHRVNPEYDNAIWSIIEIG